MTVITDPAKLERAALDVLGLLPDAWLVGRACWCPDTHRWAVTARAPQFGRGVAPETISGTGEDELAAMTDLAIRLDERRRADKPIEIGGRIPAAFIDGAEERSRATVAIPRFVRLTRYVSGVRWVPGSNPGAPADPQPSHAERVCRRRTTTTGHRSTNSRHRSATSS